jgi:ABC-type sugar transport system substrate-binding protein
VRLGLFLVSAGNLYQAHQKESALAAARETGIELEVFFAEGEGKTQREQILSFLRSDAVPDGLIVHAVEEAGLRLVAQEAVRKGIPWLMVNRSPAWVTELTTGSGGLAFCISADQRGIGRLQGEQFQRLLPEGGTVLYVTGPSQAGSAKERRAGMDEAKGALLSIISVVGAWTETSGHDAVGAWLEMTRGFVPFDLVGAQNDDMAMGALRALQEAAVPFGRPEWRAFPATGVDGLPQYGQRLVDETRLEATIVMPTTTGRAVELLAAALRGGPHPPPMTKVPVSSYPQVDRLKERR